jgi:PPOX class probable F420-dependent enzyme
VSVDPIPARERFAAATVARLATVGPDGHPHLVPITFALLGEARLVTAVDHKPKRTTSLQRLANIDANPHVSVLVDHYEDDWNELWWARADGRARIVSVGQEPELRGGAVAALVRRYHQYADRAPAGDLIVIEVARFSGWSPTYSTAS